MWNAGGWFGSQIGATSWMVLAAFLTGLRDPLIGVLTLVLAAVPNTLGYVMWRRRAELSCYRSIQLLLIVSGVCGLGVISLLDANELLEPIQIGGTVSAAWAYIVLLSTIGLLLLSFQLRFGPAEAEAEKNASTRR